MVKLIVISLVVLVTNIPFGYWRANVRRFSIQWMVAIHAPVVLVIAIRLASGIGFEWITYVALVAAFFLGQQTGAFALQRLRRSCSEVTSCLVMDIVRCQRT